MIKMRIILSILQLLLMGKSQFVKISIRKSQFEIISIRKISFQKILNSKKNYKS